MDLILPAGNLPSLKAAVEHGASAVYIGFRDDTNARHFGGLNFTGSQAARGIAHAHDRGVRVLAAVNTYAQADGWSRWTHAVDRAADLGVDALILADIGLMDYARERHPDLRLHLSVQGSATSAEAIAFYHRRFGIRRAVLPRVLSLAQIRRVARASPVEIEVFGFGSLCVMVEGRCLLSSYVTGRSPNTFGACSPADAVRWKETPEGRESRLNGVLIDRYGPQEHAGYPTLCKGRFHACDRDYYALEEPASLNTLDLLPQLDAAGVQAIKIEGRQRSPAYVALVARVWRDALDAHANEGQGFKVRPQWAQALSTLSEGAQTTFGAYERSWQ
ncbi:MAG: U32 family peptidase [Rhodocyclaceae bacterium]|nr:U32 family peptidase [Gammaproteobacteria bacterium]MCB1886349.1 U32 family peptidase [Rhodocyclaceae bacterium]MCP5135354.1 U32 family peptidase [Gammaproteobacteria bacterium]